MGTWTGMSRVDRLNCYWQNSFWKNLLGKQRDEWFSTSLIELYVNYKWAHEHRGHVFTRVIFLHRLNVIFNWCTIKNSLLREGLMNLFIYWWQKPQIVIWKNGIQATESCSSWQIDTSELFHAHLPSVCVEEKRYKTFAVTFGFYNMSTTGTRPAAVE